MGESNFEISSAVLLQSAVQVIDDLHISEQNIDTQGDIFEYITSHLKTAGLNGQFRTPRHIIRMMIEMIDPDVNQKICDPACGTAGFLVNSYLHILKKYTSKNLIKFDEEGLASMIRRSRCSPVHQLLRSRFENSAACRTLNPSSNQTAARSDSCMGSGWGETASADSAAPVSGTIAPEAERSEADSVG